MSLMSPGHLEDGPAAWGEGPGVITPDGCGVDLYAQLPHRGEPQIIHAAIPEGARILELGSGAGRLVHPLLELGHEVVAVDESAEMLAHVRGARTVHATIQELELPDRFDAVLMASYLVNVPDDRMRRAFLRTARRHLAAGGCVLIQRHEPGWFDAAADGEAIIDGVTYALRDVSRPAPGLVRATMVYTLPDGRTWTHHFTTCRVDDTELEAELDAADLAVDTYLEPDRVWVRAVAR